MSQNELSTRRLIRDKEVVGKRVTVRSSQSANSSGHSTSQTRGSHTTSQTAAVVTPNDKGHLDSQPMIDVAGVYNIGRNASSPLREFVASFYLFAEKSGPDGAAVRRRKVGFASCDRKGAGRISFMEFESFVWTKLKMEYGDKRGNALYDKFAPSFNLAFEATKEVRKVYRAAGHGCDDAGGEFISFQFFRILNIYLCVYAGMLDAFSSIVGQEQANLTKADTAADLVITRDMWRTEYVSLGCSGFVFPSTLEAAETAFNVMCFISSTDEDACVDFNAFCKWVNGFEIKSYTPLGEFLNGTADVLTEAKSVKSMSSRTVSTANTSGKSTRSQINETKRIDFPLDTSTHIATPLIKAPRKRFQRRDSNESSRSGNISSRSEHIFNNVANETKRQEERLSSIRSGNDWNGQQTEEKKDDPLASSQTSQNSNGLRSILKRSNTTSTSRFSTTRRRSSTQKERNQPLHRQSSITLLNMMRQSFVIPKMTKSSKIAIQDALRELSPNARLALQDFSEHLKVLDKEALDEDMFNILLDDMGYKRDRTGLFDELLDDIQEVNPSFPAKKDISVDDMLALYISESYHLLDNGKDTGSALMEYIDELFDEVDVNRSGGIDKNEVGLLIEKLIARQPSKEEVDALFHVLDADRSGIIDRTEFKQWVLKPNANHDIGIPSKFYDVDMFLLLLLLQFL